MEKKRIAKWNLDAEGNLSLVNAQTKVEVKNINLNNVWPDFNSRPEFERFYLVYGIKQERSDAWAGTAGIEKLNGIASDLTVEGIKGQTFARAKGSGISYKEQAEKAAAEAIKMAELVLGAIMKFPPKQQKQWFDELSADDQETFIELAKKKGVKLSV